MADEVREGGYSWRATGEADRPPPGPGEAARDAATEKSAPTPSDYPQSSTGEAWWQSGRYVEPRRHHHHPKSTGVVLVALGILLLVVNSGLFTIEWRYMWPLIFIGLGVILLARQAGWGR